MRTSWRLLVLTGLATVLYGPSLVRADIYTSVDAKGRQFFTNVPAASQSRLYLSEPAIIKPSGRAWPEVRVGGRRAAPGSSLAYDRHIQRSGHRYNIDPHLIKAIIKTESDFDCYASSAKGAQGLMQLMPGTARDLNVLNSFDARANIEGGTRYLRTMLDIFNGNIPLSLAAYNAGPNLVKRLNRIPQIPETEQYIKRVLRHYKEYQLSGRPATPVGSAIKVGDLMVQK